MQRSVWLMPTVFLVGCSTSPCADFLDHFWPAKPPASPGIGAYGGVCDPAPKGPGVAGGPVAPGTPPALAPGAPGMGPPVVPAPGPTAPPPGANPNTPYIPGAASPPPPLNPTLGSLPAPDLNATPTSTPTQPGGMDAKPLPAPPPSDAPPY